MMDGDIHGCSSMENIANIEEGGDSYVWVVNKKKEEDYDGEHVISRK